MRKTKVVLAVGLIGIILIISSFYFNCYFIQKSISGNNEEGIKNSIFYLHKDYIGGQEEIKIIDEFNYDLNYFRLPQLKKPPIINATS